MGSVFSSDNILSSGKNKNSIQPAPASYIDEISGYEQVPVTNNDGSITYITRALPLSEEEKKQQLELNNIREQALAEIQKLSSADYVLSDIQQQALNDYSSLKQSSLDESFDERKQFESDELARRGLQDSTAANTINRQTKQDEYDASKTLEKESSLLKEDLRNNELSNQKYLYNLANDKINYDQAKLQSASSGNLSALNAMNTTSLASLNDYYSRNNSVSNQQSPFLNSLLNPLTSEGGNIAKGLGEGLTTGFISSFANSLI